MGRLRLRCRCHSAAFEMTTPSPDAGFETGELFLSDSYAVVAKIARAISCRTDW